MQFTQSAWLLLTSSTSLSLLYFINHLLIYVPFKPCTICRLPTMTSTLQTPPRCAIASLALLPSSSLSIPPSPTLPLPSLLLTICAYLAASSPPPPSQSKLMLTFALFMYILLDGWFAYRERGLARVPRYSNRSSRK